MRSRYIGAIAVIALLAIGRGVAARTQLAGAGSFDGIVVRFGTTDPIAGVNVEMRRMEGTAASPLLPPVYPGGAFSPGAIVIPNEPNPGDAYYAVTGSDGSFRFTNLKPGKYRLLAAHPNGSYYPAEYGQRNPRGPGYDFRIDEAQSMKIRIEMAPMASVSGRVTGADGKPAAHAHVMAAEIRYQNGARVLNQIQGVETDERGNYRLFWLPPGRYYIGAFPEGIRRRQYAVPFGPPARVEGLNQTFSQALMNYRSGPDGELVREVYETVYSPGETNPEFARIVDLRLGSNIAGVDIALAAGRRRAVRIRGAVIDSATGQPVSGASVRAFPGVTGPVTVAPVTTTGVDGAYEIDGVMQGNSLVVATIGEGNGRRSAIHSLTVESADIDGLKLFVNAGLNLSGRITLDGADAEGYRIGFVSENSLLPSSNSGASSQGMFSIPGLQPGRYRVSVLPPGGSSATGYVKSIRLGGAESANGIVQVGESPSATLEIGLGRNGGIVEGRVVDTQLQPSANVMIVLVPTASRRPDLFKTVATDLAGHFRIQGVAPGTYLAFAWSWLPAGLWQYPEFIRTVESRGTRAAISEGASENLELTLLPEVTF